jgi:hypothetical protein
MAKVNLFKDDELTKNNECNGIQIDLENGDFIYIEINIADTIHIHTTFKKCFIISPINPYTIELDIIDN